jgi:hypothetical protein
MQTPEDVQAMLKLGSLDFYGGKLVAAMDRQHPRDLFDVCSPPPTRASRRRSATAFVILEP